MILLIDNYDSFAHNLARYLRQLGPEVLVVRNDALSTDEIAGLNPAAIVISPGPGTPDQSGVCLPLVRDLKSRFPILGVCLGHQAICQALGTRIERTFPVHGRSRMVQHTGHPLFNLMESPFRAGRYHSLIVDDSSLSADLEVIARTVDDGIIMAVAHRQFPVFGVQFHPESILTEGGYRLLGNFLGLIGIDYNRQIATHESAIQTTIPLAEKAVERSWPISRPHQYQ